MPCRISSIIIIRNYPLIRGAPDSRSGTIGWLVCGVGEWRGGEEVGVPWGGGVGWGWGVGKGRDSSSVLSSC